MAKNWEQPNYGTQPSEETPAYDAQTYASLRADAEQILARYPSKRSAVGPMLHLVQSVDAYVSPRGIEFVSEMTGVSAAEVSGVATFYSQYKRYPNGEYTVGVCTNTLCAVMGGDAIFDALSDHLGIGHDETTPDGKITLERVECNAACDCAPVVMTNWEFQDKQTPESAIALVDAIIAGQPIQSTRGSEQVSSFKETSRVLAGFPDGKAMEGPAGGEEALRGIRYAKEQGWVGDGHAGTDSKEGQA